MKIKCLVTLILLILSAAKIFAQIRPSVPAPPPVIPEKREIPTMPESQMGEKHKKFEDDTDDVVRVDTTLVQIDTVVLDKNGKLVPDLKAADFEILQDGKPQKVDFFSYIPSGGEQIKVQNPIAKVTPPLQSNFGVEKLKRTIAFVVDDTCMSFASVNAVRASLMDFVNNQMQDGDLVGIFRTRSGNGTLQQFTGDKSLLIKGIKAITFSQVLGCQNDFAPNRDNSTLKQGQAGAATFQDPTAVKAEARINSIRRETVSLGSVKTVEYLVRGMQIIPGRKAMILLSDGLFSTNEGSNQTLTAMRRLVNFANQSSVVIYAMNSGGLFDSTLISAADEVLPFSGDGGGGNDIEKLITKRTDIYRNGLDGLRYLAYATGGTFINNSNDLNAGFRRILGDQKGYYLIGYQPDESTRKLDSNFRKLTVRVKRPELTVRHRFGFYGAINSKDSAKPKSVDSELYRSLISPLALNSLHLKFTPFITREGKDSIVRYLIHINAGDITFAQQPGGAQRLSLDVVAVIFGPDGKVVDEFNHTNKALLKGGNMQQILQNGLSYTGEFGIKKPGVYQIRAAIRDVTSGKIGTVSQLVEIPEPADKSLSMSQIIISGETEPFPPVVPPARKVDEALSFPQSTTGPAIRKFIAGKGLGYGYTIYNPKIDPQTNKPNLTSEVKIYQDGMLLYRVSESPVNISQIDSSGFVQDSGVVPLQLDMPAGIYAMQVIVKDLNGHQKTIDRWSDFEVVK